MALLKYLLRVLLLLFLLPAVLCAPDSSEVCTPEEIENCSCFSYLVEQVRENDKNLFEVQNIFLPPNAAPPVFVVVVYHFQDAERDESATEVWFWSTSIFYIWQPLNVFQFTSLFFADNTMLASEAHLTLPLQCINASDAHKKLLTQRVSPQWLCAGNDVIFSVSIS